MIDNQKKRALKLAKKFINRRKLYNQYDSSVCELIKDVYIRAYKQALHDNTI